MFFCIQRMGARVFSFSNLRICILLSIHFENFYNLICLLALQNEVEICRGEQPFEIKVGHADEQPNSPGSAMETESIAATPESSSVDPIQPSTSTETPPVIVVQTPTKTGLYGVVER